MDTINTTQTPSINAGASVQPQGSCLGGLRSAAAVIGGVFVGAVAVATWLCSLALCRKQVRSVPIVHEDVTLTEEGVKVWEQMLDPNSPIGKPRLGLHHHAKNDSSQ